jgi:hypothetical protein
MRGTVANAARMQARAASTSGAKTRAARKPRTTLGRLAIISMPGLTTALALRSRNSLVKMAASRARGAPNSME